VFANGGRKVIPTLIDRLQHLYGKTIYRHDQRTCEGCNVKEWENQSEPAIVDNSQQVIDPMTAYQMTSILEGVVQRGTGTYAKRLNRPVAGKTGTTNDYKDAWFVGFTPELVVGVYVGYDTPRKLGNAATGGTLATPIFTDFMQMALAGTPKTKFTEPPGLNDVWIDPMTGVRAQEGGRAILESFNPGTGPNPATTVIGVGGYGVQQVYDPNAGVQPGYQQDDGRYYQDQGGGVYQEEQGRGGLF
jgi:penicillin-binding protein 1A